MAFAVARRRNSHNRILPGFGITLGYSILYLSVLILIPLAMLFVKMHLLSWSEIRDTVTDPEVTSAFRLSFGASFAAAVVNVFSGTLVAWVLARYRFFGRSLVDGLVDLPFALPTAVAGLSLGILYSQDGLFGRFLVAHNIQVANTALGVSIALMVIGLPFVVRTVQPVLEDMATDAEEAAASLGASRYQIFRRIILPAITPAMITGFALAFARGLGEYGSVIFISAGIPGQTEIVPQTIMNELSNFEFGKAATIAVMMLLASFVLLLFINVLQWWTRKQQGGSE